MCGGHDGTRGAVVQTARVPDAVQHERTKAGYVVRERTCARGAPLIRDRPTRGAS